MAGGTLEGIKGFLISQSEGEAPRLKGWQNDKRRALCSTAGESSVLPVTRTAAVRVRCDASRDWTWEGSKKVSASLFQALPGHASMWRSRCMGGSRGRTPAGCGTAPRASSARGVKRDCSNFARVTQEAPAAEIVVYTGDCFEESKSKASRGRRGANTILDIPPREEHGHASTCSTRNPQDFAA
jgi:hypothetical protein